MRQAPSPLKTRWIGCTNPAACLVLLEIRIGFQHHVILVQLRVHGVDQALAESVVERAVDGVRSDAKPRRGGAIDTSDTARPPVC
jgi:hypothetical protein